MVSANTFRPHVAAASAAWLLFVPLPLHAGPFGYEGGMKYEQAMRISSDLIPEFSLKGRFLVARTPPEPHPYFEFYMLSFSPQHGLCAINARGSIYLPTDFRPRFSEIERVLEGKYGKPSLRDLQVDFKRPFDSLKKNGGGKWRVEWKNVQSKNVPSSIEEIILNVFSVDVSPPIDQPQYVIGLTYRFKTQSRCKEEEGERFRKPL